MADKRKVKLIESSDDDDFSTKKTSKTASKLSDPLRDQYIKEVEEFDSREIVRRRIKLLLFVMVGIIIIIGLLSHFVKGNTSIGVDGIKISDKGVTSSVSKVYDATVYIENFDNGKVATTGTGFVYKKDRTKGYILTNYHVVSGSSAIKVTLSDDTKVDAKFIGGDQYSDIAIISIPSKNVKDVASFGSSKKASVGDIVFTVGSPINNTYRGTVTRGILSGKNRLVTIPTSNGDYYSVKVIQTDAATNPGNSGGPLCNENGEVIGMISDKIVSDKLEGISFAISIEDIKSKLTSYEKGTASSKPYMGISMVNLSDTSSMSYYGLSQKVNTNLTQGVVVESIKTNTPAVGVLRVADIITRIDDVATPDMSYLRYELYRHNVGEKIKITIERNGKTKNVSLTLGEKKR